jgi:glutaredoxin-like YruB-family protein
MKREKVTSHQDFLERSAGNEKTYLLLYRQGSNQSECALRNIDHELDGVSTAKIFIADVSEVCDIHNIYGITSVPSLLVFTNGKLSNVIKGCQESDYYRSLIANTLYHSQNTSRGNTPKRVTVYSTPTCSWCNTLKSWLKKNDIPFSDVDVSRDQHAAEELVMRTGQQGVPQTDINGEIVVGFNQQKLKELLGL